MESKVAYKELKPSDFLSPGTDGSDEDGGEDEYEMEYFEYYGDGDGNGTGSGAEEEEEEGQVESGVEKTNKVILPVSDSLFYKSGSEPASSTGAAFTNLVENLVTFEDELLPEEGNLATEKEEPVIKKEEEKAKTGNKEKKKESKLKSKQLSYRRQNLKSVRRT